MERLHIRQKIEATVIFGITISKYIVLMTFRPQTAVIIMGICAICYIALVYMWYIIKPR